MRVAINGIGIAGPTLAWWLRHYGHEPVLFDHAPALRTGGYLIDFWGLGYEIAERMGILPAVRRQSYEMAWMRLVGGDGRSQGVVDLSPMREVLDGRFISIARSDLSAAIFDACEGIPSHFGVTITTVTPDRDGVLVTLSDGRTERFDGVVGADGLHSHVRAEVFGPPSRFERFLGCRVAAARLRGYPHRDELTYVSHTVPGRQVARVSMRDDETLILLVWRTDPADQDPPPDRLLPELRRVFGGLRWEVTGILDALERVDQLYLDRVSQMHVPSWASGRVVLVGDAAASPSLLAGEGTGLAMLEAFVLAGELHRAGPDVVRAGVAYDQRLRAFVTAKQRAALRMRGFFTPRNRLTLGVRNLAVRAFAQRWLARRLLPRALRDDFELPRYEPV